MHQHSLHSNKMVVPKNLREDPDVNRRLMELHGVYFVWQVVIPLNEADWIVPSSIIWNDPNLFVTLLPHLKIDDVKYSGMPNKEDALRSLVSRFAWSIRNDPDLVWTVLKSDGLEINAWQRVRLHARADLERLSLHSSRRGKTATPTATAAGTPLEKQ